MKFATFMGRDLVILRFARTHLNTKDFLPGFKPRVTPCLVKTNEIYPKYLRNSKFRPKAISCLEKNFHKHMPRWQLRALWTSVIFHIQDQKRLKLLANLEQVESTKKTALITVTLSIRKTTRNQVSNRLL